MRDTEKLLMDILLQNFIADIIAHEPFFRIIFRDFLKKVVFSGARALFTNIYGNISGRVMKFGMYTQGTDSKKSEFFKKRFRT